MERQRKGTATNQVYATIAFNVSFWSGLNVLEDTLVLCIILLSIICADGSLILPCSFHWFKPLITLFPPNNSIKPLDLASSGRYILATRRYNNTYTRGEAVSMRRLWRKLMVKQAVLVGETLPLIPSFKIFKIFSFI